MSALDEAQTSPAAKKTGVYLLETFYLKQGTQPARIHEYLSKAALPALSKVHSGPKIVLEGLVVPHTPQVVVILGFQSIEEFWGVRAKLNADRELEKAFEAWQAGAEPPFEQQTNALLEATDYSPEVVPLDPPPQTPRIFELRVYHSPTYRQLKALHERFAGPEIRIFHRVGVHPILYTSTVIGPNMPNLTYVIPFADLAAREKAWNAFGADPEWVKVRQASIDQSGQISLYNQISLYRATAYSPIR
jgi:hypothetical protein